MSGCKQNFLWDDKKEQVDAEKQIQWSQCFTKLMTCSTLTVRNYCYIKTRSTLHTPIVKWVFDSDFWRTFYSLTTDLKGICTLKQQTSLWILQCWITPSTFFCNMICKNKIFITAWQIYQLSDALLANIGPITDISILLCVLPDMHSFYKIIIQEKDVRKNVLNDQWNLLFKCTDIILDNKVYC